jgi:AsmA protein
LAGLVRNVEAKLGLKDRPSEKPKTDFAELVMPFSLTDGLFKTDGTVLNCPYQKLNPELCTIVNRLIGDEEAMKFLRKA